MASLKSKKKKTPKPVLVKDAEAAPVKGAVETPVESPVDAPVEAVSETSESVVDAGPTDLKKGEFADLVAERAGVKRSEAKALIEATMAVMSEQLAAGRSVKMPELGNMKVAKRKETPNGEMLVCRLKLPKTRSEAQPKADPMDSVL